MGFFSTTTTSPPPPKISSDGAPIAPDRTQRAKCWEGRDGYFKCLDKNGIIDSIGEKDKAEKACASEARGFEANCASSWVSGYFLFVDMLARATDVAVAKGAESARANGFWNRSRTSRSGE